MRDALDRGKLKAVYDRVARRYDIQHALFTARSDQRGRKLVVENAVRPGDRVLDCGAGTGSTALLAALRQAGGRIVFEKHIGIPLWPFVVFVVEKPVSG